MSYDVKAAWLIVCRQNCLVLTEEQKMENAELATMWQKY